MEEIWVGVNFPVRVGARPVAVDSRAVDSRVAHKVQRAGVLQVIPASSAVTLHWVGISLLHRAGLVGSFRPQEPILVNVWLPNNYPDALIVVLGLRHPHCSLAAHYLALKRLKSHYC
jgi:hypothetical protein